MQPIKKNSLVSGTNKLLKTKNGKVKTLPPIPVPENHINQFVQQVSQSFVNKMVAIRADNLEYFFEHAIFESIEDKYLRVTALSTHYKLEELDGKNSAQASSRLLERVKPVRLESHRNLSASLIRRGMVDKSKDRELSLEYMHLKSDPRLHPKIKKVLPSHMNYAVGIPLFVQSVPIGVLWGIRRHTLTKTELKEVKKQLNSLAEGISNIVYNESNDIKNAPVSRVFIEKIDTRSRHIKTAYREVEGQKQLLKEVTKYSYPYKTKYTKASSYLLDTADGARISLQCFTPEKLNRSQYVLLMIPGFFCNRNCLDALAMDLSFTQGYQVYSLDKRGRSRETMSGINSGATNWTIDDYIWHDFPRAVEWISKRHPKKKILVYGHSMGGMIPRFYCASYYRRPVDVYDADPDKIAGIVSITSPSYINIKANMAGFETVKWSARFIARNIFVVLFSKLVGAIASQTIPTLNLQRFFSFWHNLHDDMRKVSFAVGTEVGTVNDFIGYPQITPPELTFLLDDVFCEESTRVLFQFMRSQFSDKEFLSYDDKINYTEDLKNLNKPLFSVVGLQDKIVPPETVKNAWQKIKSPNKQKIEIDQGHLGVIMYPDAVKKISTDSVDWINTI